MTLHKPARSSFQSMPRLRLTGPYTRLLFSSTCLRLYGLCARFERILGCFPSRISPCCCCMVIVVRGKKRLPAAYSPSRLFSVPVVTMPPDSQRDRTYADRERSASCCRPEWGSPPSSNVALEQVFSRVKPGRSVALVDGHMRASFLANHEAPYGLALVLGHARQISIEWQHEFAFLDAICQIIYRMRTPVFRNRRPLRYELLSSAGCVRSDTSLIGLSL